MNLNFFSSPQWRVWVDRFLTPVDDPGSRLFHLNLLSTLALIGLWVYFSGSPQKIRALLFRKKYWWNRSTRVDYQIYFLNSVLKVLLFLPFLNFGFFFSSHTARALLAVWGDFPSLPASPVNLFLFTVAAFAFDDFLRFFHHFLMHKIPFLWRLHRVHHSARILTPVTLYRTHPLESAMATVRNSLSFGVATGAFIFLFDGRFNLFTFFGVNVLGFTFNLLGANLRHSHVPLSFGWLERIFISPKQHQIHHSRAPEHYDRNFGVSLSVWDALAGSLVYSREVGLIRVGLSDSHSYSLRRQIFGRLLDLRLSPLPMKERTPMKIALVLGLLLPLNGHSSVETAVQNYAAKVYRDYSASVDTAQNLKVAISALATAPSEQTLGAAREAWHRAREAYSPTEAYRFYGGPIDDENGPEGRINAWPLDEAYIDYVVGNKESGIINAPNLYPEITPALLSSLNERDGEKNIATGFHAVEFLLWGQDFNPDGPGNRSYKDYVVGQKNAERRIAYLTAVAALLVEDLSAVRDAWAPTGATYGAAFAQSGREGLRRILLGTYRLAAEELSHERMYVAYDTQAQEDEHSCFSDTTDRDLRDNFRGIRETLLAAGGAHDLLLGVNPARAAELRAAVLRGAAAVGAIPHPFDRAIYSTDGREKILAAVTAVEDLAPVIKAAATDLGISIE